MNRNEGVVIFKKVKNDDDASRSDLLNSDYDPCLCNNSFKNLFGISLINNKLNEADIDG